MKIKYPQDSSAPADPAMYTVDVLRGSVMSAPAHLSEETLMNLAHNGVPYTDFVELIREDLGKRVEKLTSWTKPLELSVAVAKEGGVIPQRLSRLAAGSARSKGYIFEDRQEELEDEDNLDHLDRALGDQSTPWWDDPLGGSPSTLEDTVLSLLSSGFDPEGCGVLRSKCNAVAKTRLKPFQTKYHIAVDMSCAAFVIPGGSHADAGSHCTEADLIAQIPSVCLNQGKCKSRVVSATSPIRMVTPQMRLSVMFWYAGLFGGSQRTTTNTLHSSPVTRARCRRMSRRSAQLPL